MKKTNRYLNFNNSYLICVSNNINIIQIYHCLIASNSELQKVQEKETQLLSNNEEMTSTGLYIYKLMILLML